MRLVTNLALASVWETATTLRTLRFDDADYPIYHRRRLHLGNPGKDRLTPKIAWRTINHGSWRSLRGGGMILFGRGEVFDFVALASSSSGNGEDPATVGDHVNDYLPMICSCDKA